MATPHMDYPAVLFTTPGRRPRRVPSWIPQAYAIQIATMREIRRLVHLPELTVVRAQEPQSLLDEEHLLRLLSSRLDRTPEPAKILFAFELKSTDPEPEPLFQMLTRFRRPKDLEFAWGSQQAASAISESVAKIWARSPARPDGDHGSDPLGEVESVIAATADLHAGSGRLSARKVAEAFGLSLAELASLIGRSRQALWKTDDSVAVQPSLLPFERVARLRALLSDFDFRSWLNMSNDQLDDRTPIDVIREGKSEVIADLAADMLTGSPD
jgi:hypothetical protein